MSGILESVLDFLRRYGSWLCVMVLVPIFLPLIAQTFAWLTETNARTKEKIKPVFAIKDGQLIWVTIAMGAAGVWELPNTRGHNGLLLGLAIFLGLLAAILFGRTAGRPVAYPPKPPAGLIVMWSSIVIVLAMTVVCTIIHIQATSSHPPKAPERAKNPLENSSLQVKQKVYTLD